MDPSRNGTERIWPLLSAQHVEHSPCRTWRVYQICELYIDDALIHGRDLVPFLHNVRTVFDSRVHDKWSFEQLPLVQRIMNTVEKTSIGVTPADLILSHSIRLTSHIMPPVNSSIDSSDTFLSDRMDEWVPRQHTLLVVAQESQLQSDQHKVVENDAAITNYPINSYVLYTPPTTVKKLIRP
jgi:hypothetical protein